MDKAGVAFTVLLITLAAVVISVLLIEVSPPAPDTKGGGLLDAPADAPME